MDKDIDISEIFDDLDDFDSLPMPEMSVRGKRKKNRIFREVFGSKNVPHPEVDNIYERTRSFFARKIKILKYKVKNAK